MTAEVVPLRESASLMDIVGQIRAFADRIEAGEYGEVDAVIALMPRARDYPRLWGWGDVTGVNDPLIQMNLCKHWLMLNLVERR